MKHSKSEPYSKLYIPSRSAGGDATNFQIRRNLLGLHRTAILRPNSYEIAKQTEKNNIRRRVAEVKIVTGVVCLFTRKLTVSGLKMECSVDVFVSNSTAIDPEIYQVWPQIKINKKPRNEWKLCHLAAFVFNSSSIEYQSIILNPSFTALGGRKFRSWGCRDSPTARNPSNMGR